MVRMSLVSGCALCGIVGKSETHQKQVKDGAGCAETLKITASHMAVNSQQNKQMLSTKGSINYFFLLNCISLQLL